MLLRSVAAMFVFVIACGERATEDESTSPVLVAPNGPKTVFVTEGTFTGALGGFAGADAKCQREADAAGLSGRYVAWLSGEGVSAKGRVSDDDAVGPYVLVTGDVVASSFRALRSGSLQHAIDRTAKGEEPSPSSGETQCGGNLVWTSTRANGEFTGSDCDGWTTEAVSSDDWPMLGIAGATTTQWTAWCVGPRCNFAAHLYCIQD